MNVNGSCAEMLTIPSWVDADTVITNPNVPLDIFLPPQEFSHVHLLVTADPNGLNNGVFFIKVDPWSIKLLSSVVAYRVFHPETQLTFRDQSALGEVLKEQPFKKSFLLLPQRWFNAYQVGSHDDNARSFQIRRGDLLVHFPGVTNRDECMGKYLDRAERHMPDWELDLASTSYPNEIKEYWAAQYEILSQERNKTQEAAKDAEALLGKVESQLGIHRSNLGNSIVETVEQHMKSLKTTLNDHKDDLEALTTASKILIGVNHFAPPSSVYKYISPF